MAQLSRQSLTVLIPCKNELHNLPACIQSVRAIADEILVADSGSTDGTLEFVRNQPDCRLVEREYVNSGNFKNWAIPQAQSSWIFLIDADERMEPQLADEVRQLLAVPPDHDGYWAYRRNFFMGHRLDHTAWARDRVIRLFRRDARYAEYTDHSEVDLPAERTGTLRNKLTHYTCWTYPDYLPKMLHYARQQAELWHAEGRRWSWRRMMMNGPLRFLRSYVWERGFLDGAAGFQVSVLTGFYSFLKQAQLWQLQAGRTLSEVETSDSAHPARRKPMPVALAGVDRRQ